MFLSKTQLYTPMSEDTNINFVTDLIDWTTHLPELISSKLPLPMSQFHAVWSGFHKDIFSTYRGRGESVKTVPRCPTTNKLGEDTRTKHCTWSITTCYDFHIEWMNEWMNRYYDANLVCQMFASGISTHVYINPNPNLIIFTETHKFVVECKMIRQLQ